MELSQEPLAELLRVGVIRVALDHLVRDDREIFRVVIDRTAEIGNALLGALPIALGHGAGGEARRPLGLCVVGGLLFSQLITLYLTPVVYLYLSGVQERFEARRRTPSTEVALAPSGD